MSSLLNANLAFQFYYEIFCVFLMNFKSLHDANMVPFAIWVVTQITHTIGLTAAVQTGIKMHENSVTSTLMFSLHEGI